MFGRLLVDNVNGQEKEKLANQQGQKAAER